MSRAALRTFRRYPTLHVRIAGDDGEVALETPFVFVGNNPYGGDGVGASRARAARRGQAGRAHGAGDDPARTRSASRLLAALGRLDDARRRVARGAARS